MVFECYTQNKPNVSIFCLLYLEASVICKWQLSKKRDSCLYVRARRKSQTTQMATSSPEKQLTQGHTRSCKSTDMCRFHSCSSGCKVGRELCNIYQWDWALILSQAEFVMKGRQMVQ
jgi:hypothetical protein